MQSKLPHIEKCFSFYLKHTHTHTNTLIHTDLLQMNGFSSDDIFDDHVLLPTVCDNSGEKEKQAKLNKLQQIVRMTLAETKFKHKKRRRKTALYK